MRAEKKRKNKGRTPGGEDQIPKGTEHLAKDFGHQVIDNRSPGIMVSSAFWNSLSGSV